MNMFLHGFTFALILESCNGAFIQLCEYCGICVSASFSRCSDGDSSVGTL